MHFIVAKYAQFMVLIYSPQKSALKLSVCLAMFVCHVRVSVLKLLNRFS